jgi:hypothetical protein
MKKAKPPQKASLHQQQQQDTQQGVVSCKSAYTEHAHEEGKATPKGQPAPAAAAATS